MAANDISELVKLADSLVYENKGEHLTQRQKDILRQTLKGKKNSAIWFPRLKNSYVKSHLIPELWELLAEVVGEEVNKRNVLTVLQRIQQLRQSGTASRSLALTNTQVELNGHVASNGSVSWLGNRFSTSTADAAKSNEESHQSRVSEGTNPNYTARPHPNHLHSSGVRGNRLLNNGHLSESLDTEFAQNKKPDSSHNSNTQELHLSLRTVLPEDEEASSSTFCRPDYMNLGLTH